MNENEKMTAERKSDHIRICLEEQVSGKGVTSGFEQYRFRHCALPEMSFSEVELGTDLLGKRLKAPLLISSMTGGTEQAGMINRKLAEAAEARGWGIALGSMRAAIEREELASTFQVRKEAPTALVIANLGAVQLNCGLGPADCLRAVELAEADALVLHLNALQEAFQPEGDTDFGGLLRRIEDVCRGLPVPVGIKEVGWGIDADNARRLTDAGAAFIDVAGAGGTSWSQVEKIRQPDPIARAAAEAFADWGNPTAECVREVRVALPEAVIFASGGLESGVDAAKALALGANAAGFGRSLLRQAAVPGGDVSLELERIELELRTAMFGIGARNVAALRTTNRLYKKQER